MRLTALAGAGAAALVSPPGLWLLAGAALATQLCRRSGWRARLAALAPMASFALLLAVFEAVSRGRVSALAVRAAAAGWLAQAALGGASPSEWLLERGPGSIAFRAGLFAALVEHFARVLRSDVWRTVTAWRLASPRAWRAGWFRSLVFAVARIFERSLIRAERFYAAQWLRGLGE